MNNFLRKWDAARLIRVVTGSIFGIYGLIAGDYFTATMGALLCIMGLLNWSCCCSSGCSTSDSKKAIYKDMVEPYKANNKK